MKVFDVTFVNDMAYGRKPISVFAEDVAQATRIAVRAANKLRSQGYIKSNFTGQSQTIEVSPIDDITAEDVTKVEAIRDQVAS